jgi:hypothetical protein
LFCSFAHQQLAWEDMQANHQYITRDQIVTAMAVHPTLPLYVSSNSLGKVYVWQFGAPHALAELDPRTHSNLSSESDPEHITRIRFNSAGTKIIATTYVFVEFSFAILFWFLLSCYVFSFSFLINSAVGQVIMWSFSYSGAFDSCVVPAFENWEGHDKGVFDAVFMTGGSHVITCGDSTDHMSVFCFLFCFLFL